MTETDVFNALKYSAYDAELNAYVWRNSDGELHRENGPAVEYNDGDKEWWTNGERHRENGPAIEYTCGLEVWYIDGKKHRSNGPAISHNGYHEWYINNQPLTEEEFNVRTK